MGKKTGEIVKVNDPKLKLGRPEPKIVGAPALQPPENVKTFDRSSPVEPQVIEIRTHSEVVTVRSHVRSKPLRKDEPDVRIHTMTPEAREAWGRAKRAED